MFFFLSKRKKEKRVPLGSGIAPGSSVGLLRSSHEMGEKKGKGRRGEKGDGSSRTERVRPAGVCSFTTLSVLLFNVLLLVYIFIGRVVTVRDEFRFMNSLSRKCSTRTTSML